MNVIENFAALSEQEQKAFAEALIKTINSENTFGSEAQFEFDRAEADDVTGGLYVLASTIDTMSIPRPAAWQAGGEEDINDDPGLDAEYDNSESEDATAVFKTTSAVIDGYKVTLTVDELQDEGTEDVEVTDYTHEDSGIGWNEFWGVKSYDSQPYLEVTGILTKACYCFITLFVEPVDATNTETEATEEI